MAGRGRAPKDPDKRHRTNADPIPTTKLEGAKAEPPALPVHLSSHPEVSQWWQTWIDSAQAETFTNTDWQFLYDTAFIAHEFYNGDMKVAGEFRLRVAKFGATPEDRARLRLSVEMPGTGQGARTGGNVTNIRDRRQRLTGTDD